MEATKRKTTARSGVSRIEQNLQKSLAEKNFYESHQFYVTLNNRYHLRNKHEEARKLTMSGAYYFLEHGQFESGLHLALLYVESLEDNITEVTDDHVHGLGKLHSLIPKDLGDFENFQNRAIRWSANCSNCPKTGSCNLRREFALSLWRDHLYTQARQQFLYSSDGKKFGEMLLEFSTSFGHVEEADLFLAQAVLQLLCIRSVQVANEVFKSYTSQHPKMKQGPPYNFPLINFLCYLLAAVEKKCSAVYSVLYDKYLASIRRDSSYVRYLDQIGINYFNQKGKKNKTKGKFSFESLMQELLMDEDAADIDDYDMDLKPSISMTVEDLD